jgi:hypothetical protein
MASMIGSDRFIHRSAWKVNSPKSAPLGLVANGIHPEAGFLPGLRWSERKRAWAHDAFSSSSLG